jgi:hypothetical protein
MGLRPPGSIAPAPARMVDIELGLVRMRLDRWVMAEKRNRLGHGYPQASPIYHLMRGDTAIQAAHRELFTVELLTEFELEIQEMKEAIDRLPPLS